MNAMAWFRRIRGFIWVGLFGLFTHFTFKMAESAPDQALPEEGRTFPVLLRGGGTHYLTEVEYLLFKSPWVFIPFMAIVSLVLLWRKRNPRPEKRDG